MTIKNNMVTREQYDSLQSNLDLVMKTLKESSAWRRANEKSLRRENYRLRNWAAGLAVLSGALGIGIMVLLFPII
jgi:hypothetical protein